MTPSPIDYTATLARLDEDCDRISRQLAAPTRRAPDGRLMTEDEFADWRRRARSALSNRLLARSQIRAGMVAPRVNFAAPASMLLWSLMLIDKLLAGECPTAGDLEVLDAIRATTHLTSPN